ncbi:MAG: DUF1579 domain-containing protein [Planctomycetota bacterium]|nr:MAG: DUF1579 domain-containing protein [Planctomycetota bacterium]
MIKHPLYAVAAMLVATLSAIAQSAVGEPPVELQVIRGYAGVWDAEFEVWPGGPEAASIKFKGVETNRPYGEYWIASDLVSQVGSQTTRVHSIVGYDLDQKQLVGMIIDDGPYAATMAGQYDAESQTVTWTVKGKMPDGKPLLQVTKITQLSPTERVLVLTMPGEGDGPAAKIMQIRFTKRSDP